MSKTITELGLKKLSELGPIKYVTSGIAELDEITKFPKARITEIYGESGSGKTSLMCSCLAAMSQEGRVLYIDAENALNPERMKTFGAIPENVTISDSYILEEVAELVINSVNKFDIIVIDSIASLEMRAESDGSIGDQFIGLKARLMGQWMRKLIGPLGKSSCAVIFINQLRDSMIIYGDKKTTPGGKALPYAASLRVELSTKKADQIVGKKGATGHWVNFKLTKSKVCRPYQTGRFKISY